MVMCMLNAIFVIIGTVIGAGFASGKEVFTFFNVYGVAGLLGLIFSEAMIGLIIYKSFCIIINYNVSSYSQFVSRIFPQSKFLNNTFCNIINIFLLISFIVMVAGFSAYFAQEFYLPYFFGGIIISFLSFVTFLNNVDGLVKINLFLVPCLIFIILLLGFKNWICFTNFNFISSKNNFSWFIMSLLYASYNLIVLLPILVSLKKYIPTQKHAKNVAFLTFVFLILMTIILFFLLNYYFTDIQNIELPTIFIAGKLGTFYQYACGLLILGAIFTTAISNGYSFLENLNISRRKVYCLMSFSICLIAVVLSHIGFSTLLNLLYPILGLLRFYTNYIYLIFF